MEDRIQMVNVTAAGNFLLALILVLPNFVLLENYRAQICLFSALVYFAAQRFYDWRSTPVNVPGIYICLRTFMMIPLVSVMIFMGKYP